MMINFSSEQCCYGREKRHRAWMPRRCHYCGVIGDGRRAVGCTAAHHARRFKPYSRFGRGEAVLLLRASLDSAQLERQLERESAGQGRAGARGSRAQTKAVEVRRTDRLVQSREGGREGEQSAGGLHRLGSVWLSGWLAGRWSRSPEEHREKAWYVLSLSLSLPNVICVCGGRFVLTRDESSLSVICCVLVRLWSSLFSLVALLLWIMRFPEGPVVDGRACRSGRSRRSLIVCAF